MAFVQTLIGAYGEAYADDLALGCEDDAGAYREPLTGRRLVARAREVAERPLHVEAG